GGFTGALAMVFLLQPIGAIALEFGNAEIFVLGLFGLSALAIVLGDDVRKGLASGFFGLLFAAITADAATGKTRLTFGTPQLHDQVPFIPIIIGLFAISEMFYLIKKEKVSSERVDITYSGVMEGARWVFRHPKQLLRAVTIGVSIGAIPGAGPAISNFISWSVAKSRSATPETFGEGNPEGVLASETCDNATVAGTLIPTLTLGIPGSGSTAIMLGALLLHGIYPGPRLVTYFLTESVAIMMGVVLANVVLLFFAISISKYILRVVLIPSNILVPAIIVATAFGAYALRNSLFDVWFMVVFGILGFMMREKDYPIIPMVLGVILGPIVEPAFQRSMMLGHDNPAIFFSSRITIGLWILIVVIFILPTVLRRIDVDLGV
ncbi:MAG: tripartite tricarboxylate transporter permease, partial [Halobacteriales archaeon]|nr:tripartite tricarboxylate transporter permease [Halobacteriales archaeon]